MPTFRRTVGVVAAKFPLNSPWADFDWRATAVLPGLPDAAPHTLIARNGATEIWYLGPAELVYHSGETAHYRDNFSAGSPSVWVSLREDGEGRMQIAGVTVDPYEGEAFAEVVGDRVEAVPLHPEIADEVAAFFETHHVEQTFFKRKRDKRDPNAPGEYGLGHPARAADKRGGS